MTNPGSTEGREGHGGNAQQPPMDPRAQAVETGLIC